MTPHSIGQSAALGELHSQAHSKGQLKMFNSTYNTQMSYHLSTGGFFNSLCMLYKKSQVQLPMYELSFIPRPNHPLEYCRIILRFQFH